MIFLKEKFGKSGDEIIIEEFLDGFEVSVLCLCDGKSLIPMDLAQDYKKILMGIRVKILVVWEAIVRFLLLVKYYIRKF